MHPIPCIYGAIATWSVMNFLSLNHLLHQSALSIFEDGQWRPGIGDPNLVSWTITVGYFLAVLLASRQVFHAWKAQQSGGSSEEP
jgi:hypothetical protein